MVDTEKFWIGVIVFAIFYLFIAYPSQVLFWGIVIVAGIAVLGFVLFVIDEKWPIIRALILGIFTPYIVIETLGQVGKEYLKIVDNYITIPVYKYIMSLSIPANNLIARYWIEILLFLMIAPTSFWFYNFLNEKEKEKIIKGDF